MLCVLGAAFSYGLSALWMRRLRDTPPLVSAQAQLLCSTLLLLPVAAVVDRFWELGMPGAAGDRRPCWAWRCSRPRSPTSSSSASSPAAGPTNVMLVTLLIPVSATALGALVLGERLAANQIAGALVIASALLVIDGRIFGGWMRGNAREA